MPTSPEFQVNTTTTGKQEQPAVAALAGGGFVVVWTSDGQDGSGLGVYGQRFDDNGSRVGPEFQVNLTTLDHQFQPSVTALAGGGFFVAWTHYSPDADVHGRFFDAEGSPVTGELMLNTHTLAAQWTPRAAGLVDGGVVVTWMSSGRQDGSDWSIYGQRLNADGSRNGGEFQANTFTTLEQMYPDVAALRDGGFVITWQSYPGDSDAEGIFAQRFAADGRRAGAEFQVNTSEGGSQERPVVAGLADGGFVIAWTSAADPVGVHAQRFHADGRPNGTEFRVGSAASDRQYDPAVAALPDGGFVITWTSWYQDGWGDGVYGQRYGQDGTPDGSEFAVNVTTFGHQNDSAVAVLADGSIVPVWQSFDQDGDEWGVFGRVLRPEPVQPDGPDIIGTNRGDTLVGTGAGEAIYGRNGRDVILGLGGDDRLQGDNGNDRLYGGAGDDWLSGGNGADLLNGGPGNDILIGGRGPDIFEFGPNPADGFGPDADWVGRDAILDFKIGTDTLRLTGGIGVGAMAEADMAGPPGPDGRLGAPDGRLDTILTLTQGNLVVGTVTLVGVTGLTLLDWQGLTS